MLNLVNAALMSNTLKIVVADDHPLFRDALKQAMQGLYREVDILEFGDFDGVKAYIAENSETDLVLLDLTMPGASGLSGLVTLRAIQSQVPVVVVTAQSDRATIRRAIDLGASGFIPKSQTMEQICQSINGVLAGEVVVPEAVDVEEEIDTEIVDIITRIKSLTPQQTRVLGMLSEGLLNKQIAYELSVSEATVKAHVSAILQKLSVDSRTQAVIQLGKVTRNDT